jgi:hypothetical protein
MRIGYSKRYATLRAWAVLRSQQLLFLKPTLFLFAVLGTLMAIDPPSSFALDSLPYPQRRMPLSSYERIPIGKVLADPADYHLREVRIAGTIRTIQTEVMTRGCAMRYELTILTVEDESGLLEVIDKGACGRNAGRLRAPMLLPGDRVNLLIQTIGELKRGETGASPEAIILWIDRVQDQ